MSAVSDLYAPVIKPAPVPVQPVPTGSGVVRRADAMRVEILTTEPRSTYTSAAATVMDAVSVAHALTGKLIDVRQEKTKPRGALDLSAIADRFYDGIEELWISRPDHMPPDLIRFRGRFGFQKSVMMPKDHGNFAYICWSWIETNLGELPGIDLGVILVPTKDRWYRIFPDQSDARSYYRS